MRARLRAWDLSWTLNTAPLGLTLTLTLSLALSMHLRFELDLEYSTAALPPCTRHPQHVVGRSHDVELALRHRTCAVVSTVVSTVAQPRQARDAVASSVFWRPPTYPLPVGCSYKVAVAAREASRVATAPRWSKTVESATLHGHQSVDAGSHQHTRGEGVPPGPRGPPCPQAVGPLQPL